MDESFPRRSSRVPSGSCVTESVPAGAGCPVRPWGALSREGGPCTPPPPSSARGLPAPRPGPCRSSASAWASAQLLTLIPPRCSVPRQVWPDAPSPFPRRTRPRLPQGTASTRTCWSCVRFPSVRAAGQQASEGRRGHVHSLAGAPARLPGRGRGQRGRPVDAPSGSYSPPAFLAARLTAETVVRHHFLKNK